MKLDNGLRVIVARREGVPLVSAELVALAGAEADPPRLAGPGVAERGADDAGNQAPQRAASSPPPPRRSAARSTAAAGLEPRARLDHGDDAQARRRARAGRRGRARAGVRARRDRARSHADRSTALKVAYANPATLASIWSPSGWPTVAAPTAIPPAARPTRCRASSATDLVAAHRQRVPARQRGPDPRRRHRWREPAWRWRGVTSAAGPHRRRRSPQPPRAAADRSRARRPPSST